MAFSGGASLGSGLAFSASRTGSPMYTNAPVAEDEKLYGKP